MYSRAKEVGEQLYPDATGCAVPDTQIPNGEMYGPQWTPLARSTHVGKHLLKGLEEEKGHN